MLTYILRIERHIRSLISYYFSEKHGSSQSCYLDYNNYSSNLKKSKDITRLINMLNNLVYKNTDYPYINHYRNKYNNVPLWVLVNCLTFGTLSKFYSLISPDIQVKVSKNFDYVNEKQLEQYLSVITKFRNVCAHNERLFSYKTRNDIPDTAIHEKLDIPRKGTQYLYGKRDLFAIVIALKYLLPAKDFIKFKNSLSNIIKHYTSCSFAIDENSLYTLMGFPKNWIKISSYRK